MQRIIPKVSEKTASWTLTEQDSGQVFEIGAADLVATLPALSGLQTPVKFEFFIKTVSGGGGTGFSVSPASVDSINYGTDNKDLINSTATDVVGDAVRVVSDSNGVTWLAFVIAGTWAAEG